LALKCIKIHLAAAFGQDPLGELKRSSRPHSRDQRGKDGNGKGIGGRKGDGERRGGREGKGELPPPTRGMDALRQTGLDATKRILYHVAFEGGNGDGTWTRCIA